MPRRRSGGCSTRWHRVRCRAGIILRDVTELKLGRGGWFELVQLRVDRRGHEIEPLSIAATDELVGIETTRIALTTAFTSADALTTCGSNRPSRVQEAFGRCLAKYSQ
jgi:hypothetical protein